jgi:long-chain acyl-CoA synthetase
MFLLGARGVPGDRTCFRLRAGDGWRDLCWRDAERTTREIALGLLTEGFAPGDTLTMLAQPSPTTVAVGLAVTALRGTCAALWPTTPTDQLPELARHTEARFVLLGSARQAEVVSGQLDRFAGVRRFLVPDPRFAPGDERVRLLEDLRAAGRASSGDAELARRMAAATVDDPALLVTKRTSGLPPRLVRLSHYNLLAATEGAVAALPFSPDDVVFLAQPLADPGAWTAGVLTAVHARAPIAFPAAVDLLDDLQATAPTVLVAGPRDLSRLARRLRAAEAARGGTAALERALSLGRRIHAEARAEGRAPAGLRLRLRLGGDRALRPLRARLGGRLRRIVTWGDWLSPHAAALFVGLGVDVRHGYGLAEAAGVFAFVGPGAGGAAPLSEPVGRGELAVSPRGRLRLRGPALAAGAAGQTSDGWFEPGDRAAPTPEGPRLLGRADETLRIGDELVATRPIAALLEDEDVVSRALVFADERTGGRLAALVSIRFQALSDWAVARGMVTETRPEAVRRRAEQDLFRAIVTRVNARLGPSLQLAALWLDENDWRPGVPPLTAAGAIDRAAALARLTDCVSVPLATD